MKFGKFEIDIVSDGRFKLDGGAMFGIVPKVIWSSAYEADDHNRILLALDCLLLRFDERFVLLEGGMGDKFSKREHEIYAIDRKGGIARRLKEMDIEPGMITDVIPSHLHFDHAGFLTGKDASGKIVPSFPKAKHHFQKKHYSWAIQSSKKDAGSFKQDDFLPLMDASFVKLHDGEWSFDNDLDFFISNGHTVSQQHARLKDGHRSMIFCGDLIPTSKHLKLAYNMGYDNLPVENTREKEALLKEVADKGSMLYFYHDPEVKLVTVKSTEKGYSLDEIIPFR